MAALHARYYGIGQEMKTSTLIIIMIMSETLETLNTHTQDLVVLTNTNMRKSANSMQMLAVKGF